MLLATSAGVRVCVLCVRHQWAMCKLSKTLIVGGTGDTIWAEPASGCVCVCLCVLASGRICAYNCESSGEVNRK